MYSSRSLGVQFTYPPTYRITEAEADRVELRREDGDAGVIVLDADERRFYATQSLKPCLAASRKVDAVLPCLVADGGTRQPADVMPTRIAGVKALSFYVLLGSDGEYHVVRIDGTRSIQATAHVQGSVLETEFQRFLDTLVFTTPPTGRAIP